jgi:hypothetical protein
MTWNETMQIRPGSHKLKVNTKYFLKFCHIFPVAIFAYIIVCESYNNCPNYTGPISDLDLVRKTKN